MSEILTESFCERCGTRYTFESARPRNRLKGVKVLSRGLKNFVLSDDTTMDEAMAAARSETDREATAYQLDAFHKTFNFCMSCRQYTCPNCWNEIEARCQSCAPLPELEIAAPEVAPPAFPGLVTLSEPAMIAGSGSNGANGHDDLIGARDREVDEAATDGEVAFTEPAAWTVTPDAITPEPEALSSPPPLWEVEPATKTTSMPAGPLSRFRPGENLDDELAAFEREWMLLEAEPVVAVAEAPVEAEPVEAVAEAPVEAEPVEAVAEAPVEAEPVEAVAEAPVEAEPVEAVAEAPVEHAADLIEQPTWRITAPDSEGPPIVLPHRPADLAPAALPSTGPALPPAEPQWPVRPEWPAPQASTGLPFLGRPAQPRGGVESLWAASNRELAATSAVPGRTTSGIQPCISCGLSLSANARFCRRCGTLQGG
jgi:hypothetical protein